VEIRRLTEDDLSSIRSIEEQTDSPLSIANLLGTTQSKKMQLFVAEEPRGEGGEPQVVGWYCAQLVFPEAELHKISVIKHWRGRQVGQSLLEHLLTYLIRNKFRELFLEVRSQNHPALKFYFKNDFQEIGRRRNYYKAPLDEALILQKKLP
jgi:ribosomal-protein-alanine N-acetyltransferase